MMKSSLRWLAVLAATTAFSAATVHAEEGMWTLDKLPAKAMKAKYGFEPDQAFANKIMKSSARLANGCSGSFVSPSGLVLTNHHCIRGCVSNLSSKEHNYLEDGFLSKSHAEEKVCPGLEVNRLEQITDITKDIEAATKGLTGEAFAKAKKAAQAKAQEACVGKDSETIRCDVVELYQGGMQHVYRYTRFAEVRLVFAPEAEIGHFGGDPDNFNYPRYSFDMSMLRVYENGKPAKIKDFLKFDPKGADAGELVMVTGHPGSTQRMLTVSQLEYLRDRALPNRLFYLAEMRGFLTRFIAESDENHRIAISSLQGVENSFKALKGRLQALQDPKVMAEKRQIEQSLKQFMQSNKDGDYGTPFADIARVQNTYKHVADEYGFLEYGRGFSSGLFSHAKTLVRGAEERGKPSGERLKEFGDASLPRVKQRLLSKAPIYPDFEKAKLGWSLTKLREVLGADHPMVKTVLGKKSPQQLANELIDGSKLADPKVREDLWNNPEKVASSNDPIIQLVKRIDPYSRKLRSRVENDMEAVEDKASENIARARFAKFGDSMYPDATFSLRLSAGRIKGWTEGEKVIKPFTEAKGLYERATGQAPFALPKRWVDAEKAVNPSTRFNQVSTNDIIGGNSGSPLIDKDAHIVGLIFDGNIHSLGGAYWYDPVLNRAVSVHTAIMLEALDKVYGMKHIKKELTQ